jgi:hypothetical protein
MPMDRLLPMKEPERRSPWREPVSSLICGAPSLGIGLISLVLIASYLGGYPIGPPTFYEIELYPLAAYDPTSGQRSKLFSHILPSREMLGMLIAGTWSGGLGILISRRRRPYRHATTSIAGMITCGMAFFLVWILIIQAAIS